MISFPNKSKLGRSSQAVPVQFNTQAHKNHSSPPFTELCSHYVLSITDQCVTWISASLYIPLEISIIDQGPPSSLPDRSRENVHAGPHAALCSPLQWQQVGWRWSILSFNVSIGAEEVVLMLGTRGYYLLRPVALTRLLSYSFREAAKSWALEIAIPQKGRYICSTCRRI